MSTIVKGPLSNTPYFGPIQYDLKSKEAKHRYVEEFLRRLGINTSITGGEPLLFSTSINGHMLYVTEAGTYADISYAGNQDLLTAAMRRLYSV